MVLTTRQRQALNNLPRNQRANAAAGFNRQNNNSAPVRGRGRASTRARGTPRGRSNRGRGRGQINGGTFRRFNPRAPTAAISTMENRQSSSMSFQKVVFANEVFTKTPQDGAFTAQVIDLAPINFPYFDRFSLMFARYQFMQIFFRFKTVLGTGTPGTYWMGFEPVSTRNLPTTFSEAQHLSNFITGPLYSDAPTWSRIPAAVFHERWFIAQPFAQDSAGTIADFADRCPGRLVFGTFAAQPVQVPQFLGQIELNIRCVFKYPLIESLGAVNQPPIPPPTVPTPNPIPTNSLADVLFQWARLANIHNTQSVHDRFSKNIIRVFSTTCKDISTTNDGHNFLHPLSDRAHNERIHSQLNTILSDCERHINEHPGAEIDSTKSVIRILKNFHLDDPSRPSYDDNLLDLMQQLGINDDEEDFDEYSDVPEIITAEDAEE